MIESKLQETSKERARFIKEFSDPIVEELKEQELKFEIRGRPKSIHSIWNKMRKQGCFVREIYDLFAIRIIIDADVAEEKADCWRAYSVVTDFYHPNPDRLRDWISTPKANGYESPAHHRYGTERQMGGSADPLAKDG
jgi:GTP pyrophosphokinase